MRGGAPVVEQTCRTQHEYPGAQGGNAEHADVRLLQPVKQPRIVAGIEVATDTGNDQGIEIVIIDRRQRAGHDLHRRRRRDHPSGDGEQGKLITDGADKYRRNQFITGHKYLRRTNDIGQNDAIKHNDADMALRIAIAARLYCLKTFHLYELPESLTTLS